VGGRGGAYPGRESARAQPALQGGALFEAQSALLARYLVTREGYPFLGALVDAQVRGTPVGDVLRTAKMIPYDLERVDDEWRRWLADRAGRPGY
jgi:hypothetical protein